ncbi:2'-5' RNA ligase family protein [Marinobacter sp. 1_MG-2023]|uniref:2'-5' RNA ligase family protein n=1 Tax=Marinobacter sp. 1_MG-2023 TaxID=3062627 RepID=UPI0026E268C1|nr:2'-5' RNA ligase family protein [Marinobacter sp. 1_MG-2023]MDO6822930.1 2'-5' RNA ligase family protein [Marinobacter sp. 1_MG-2023]
MFSDFLALEATCPAELRDFREWHKGAPHFGFWAIEVTNPACLNKVEACQKHLSDKLHAGYARQPHITLALAGLLSEKQVHQNLVLRQVDQLEKRSFRAFPLQLSGCNSFAICPYIQVHDPLGNLASIRECLGSAANVDNQRVYTPHVTLGFYNEAYRPADIVGSISELSSHDIDFTVHEIVFAQYETRDVQGPYQVLHRVKLC